jgi:DNA-binding MarR family transcriptional regulator
MSAPLTSGEVFCIPRIVRRQAEKADGITPILEGLERIFRTVNVFSKRSLRRWGVTGPQLWAMRILRRGGRLTMSDLTRRMHLDMSTVSGVVDRLEEGGVVSRVRDAEDARVVRLSLTRRGRGILERAPEPPRARLARSLARLGPAELRRLGRALADLCRMLGGRS